MMSTIMSISSVGNKPSRLDNGWLKLLRSDLLENPSDNLSDV